MKTGIYMEGPKVTKKGARAAAKAVCAVLEAGHLYGADQKTIRAALDTLADYAPDSGHHISNSTFMGDQLPAPSRPHPAA